MGILRGWRTNGGSRRRRKWFLLFCMLLCNMRHTSNLEKAIAFASEHLQYPLALDFKKYFMKFL